MVVTMASEVAPGICSFPGEARQVGEARRFVARALDGCPARDRLLACVSELAANAVEHTDSGAGGTFTVAVGRPREGAAVVAVADDGGPGEPAVGGSPACPAQREPAEDETAPRENPEEAMPESGRGLALVAAFSSRWGCRRTGRGHLVWAEATWPVPVGGTGGGRRSAEGLWNDTWTNLVEPRGVA